MPIPDCPSGNCCDDLALEVAGSLNSRWHSARIQVESILQTVLSNMCNDDIYPVPPGTLPKDFRALLWPIVMPDFDLYPYLTVVEGGNIWVAPNNPITYDLGTVPATPGTGTKWRNIYTDLDNQIASAVPYTAAGAFAGLYSPPPTNVQGALDQLAASLSPSAGFLGAKVRGHSAVAGFILGDTLISSGYLTTVEYNINTIFSPANGYFTIPAGESGHYLLGGDFVGGNFNTAVGTSFGLKFRVNAESLTDPALTPYYGVNGNPNPIYLHGTRMRYLVTGDTVKMYLNVAGAANTQIFSNAGGLHFWIAKVR